MDKNFLLGFDIGGTKCAMILGRSEADGVPSILERREFPTREAGSPEAAIRRFAAAAREALSGHGIPGEALRGLGVSCGGPLDSRRGVIQSPPNLPGWDEVPVKTLLEREFPCPVRLQNDANAGAVAEWKFGAGRGAKSLAFLTFGTGLGAGLILDGRLYSGACDLAGECGHIRLAPIGPAGFGKAGSFEGFCSGGGLAQLGALRAREAIQQGHPAAWCPTIAGLPQITARTLAQAADAGDELARSVYAECGMWLGRGLAVLIDLLNLELIVIGSIFARSEHLLRPAMEAAIASDAIPAAAARCMVKPAALGEKIGDFAALSLAEGEF